MPIVNFKTITQQSFQLNLSDDATVLNAKEMLAEKGGETWAVDLQKHIYGGKVLLDTQLIGELPGIKDSTKFVSVMLIKKKTVPEKPAVPAKPATPVSKKPSDDKSPKNDPAYIPREYLPLVGNLESMGYPHDEVIRALKRAFYNAERAVEYLNEGIPENAEDEEVEATDEPESDDDIDGEEEGPVDLEQLRNDPNFQSLALVVRSNPAMLQTVLQAIASTNPRLFAAASANPNQFIALVNSIPVPGAGAAPNNVHQTVRIPATAEDRAAIDRLVAMGFPRQLALEAYLACDKNEELAVHYILANLGDFNNQFDG